MMKLLVLDVNGSVTGHRNPEHGVRCETRVATSRVFKEPVRGYPTEAPPGTPEKLAVMSIRSARFELLFHPFDSRWEGDSRPGVFVGMDWRIRGRIVRSQVRYCKRSRGR